MILTPYQKTFAVLQLFSVTQSIDPAASSCWRLLHFSLAACRTPRASQHISAKEQLTTFAYT